MDYKKLLSFRLLYWLSLGGLAGDMAVNGLGRLAGIQPDPSRLYIAFAILAFSIFCFFADRRLQNQRIDR